MWPRERHQNVLNKKVFLRVGQRSVTEERCIPFPCRKQVFLTTNESPQSQQTRVSGGCFPTQVPRALSPGTLPPAWHAGVAPARARWKKTLKDIKRRGVWKRKSVESLEGKCVRYHWHPLSLARPRAFLFGRHCFCVKQHLEAATDCRGVIR